MNKFLRVLFILVILAMTGAIIFLAILPNPIWEVIRVTVFQLDGRGRLVFGMWRFWSSSLPLT